MLRPIEFTADSINNNNNEMCTEWSEIYNNCQLKSSATEASDHRPTETSGTSDRTVVTNTAESNTSKDSSDEMAIIIGVIIGGLIFVFLLTVIVLTVIVCLRKRHLSKRSDHLINGPAVLELKCEQI